MIEKKIKPHFFKLEIKSNHEHQICYYTSSKWEKREKKNTNIISIMMWHKKKNKKKNYECIIGI